MGYPRWLTPSFREWLDTLTVEELLFLAREVHADLWKRGVPGTEALHEALLILEREHGALVRHGRDGG